MHFTCLLCTIIFQLHYASSTIIELNKQSFVWLPREIMENKVGKDLQRSSSTSLCLKNNQVHLYNSLHILVQSILKDLHQWRLHYLSRKFILFLYCSYCKNSFLVPIQSTTIHCGVILPCSFLFRIVLFVFEDNFFRKGLLPVLSHKLLMLFTQYYLFLLMAQPYLFTKVIFFFLSLGQSV